MSQRVTKAEPKRGRYRHVDDNVDMMNSATTPLNSPVPLLSLVVQPTTILPSSRQKLISIVEPLVRSPTRRVYHSPLLVPEPLLQSSAARDTLTFLMMERDWSSMNSTRT